MDAETTLKMQFQAWYNAVVWAALQGRKAPQPPPHLAPHVARFMEVDRLDVQARLAAAAADPTYDPAEAARGAARLVEMLRSAARGES